VSTADYYQMLGVSRDASRSSIKSAYRAKARVVHPDLGGNAEAFAALHDAYQALVDPVRRAAYDRSLRWGTPMPTRSPGSRASAPVRRRTGRTGRLRNFGEDKDFVPRRLILDPATLPWWEHSGRVRYLDGSGPSREQVLGAVGAWCALLLLAALLPVDSVPVQIVLWTLVVAGAVTIQRLVWRYLRTRRAERAFVLETNGRSEFGRPGDEPEQLAERLTAQAIGDYLLRLPGVKVFHGLTRPGSVFADVDHAVLLGRRLVLLESRMWLPGHYEADADGAVYRNGHVFHGGAVHLPDGVADYRRLLPGVRVRGVLVVHPSRVGLLSTDVEDGVAIPPLTAEDFVRTIGAWLAEEPPSVDREIFRTVLGQLARSGN
jgi:hypothetical protein